VGRVVVVGAASPWPAEPDAAFAGGIPTATVNTNDTNTTAAIASVRQDG
jgi:hypothetical protein